METSHRSHHGLQPEVAQRVARLSEEIRGRLVELAIITARATGVDAPQSSAIKFAPRTIKTDNAGEGDWIEIIEVEGDDGQVYEACYGVVGGQAFAESPCGG